MMYNVALEKEIVNNIAPADDWDDVFEDFGEMDEIDEVIDAWEDLDFNSGDGDSDESMDDEN